MQKWYYINASMQKVGPVTPQALKVLVENGIIGRRTTLVSEDGSQMLEAGQVNGLFPDAPAPAAPEPVKTTVFADTVQSSMPFAGDLTSQSPNDPWKSYDPFPSGIAVNDPFAAASQQGPFDRTQVTVDRSGPNGLFIGVVVALIVFLFGLLGVALVMSLMKKPTETAEKPAITDRTADNNTDNSADYRVEKSEEKPASSTRIVDEKIEFPPAPPRKIPSKTRVSASFESQSNYSPSTPPIISAVQSMGGTAIPESTRKSRYGKRDTEEIVAETESSVALVSGKMGSGSGFVVLPGIVATNSHVINSEKVDEIEVIFPSATGVKKGPFKAQLLYEDVRRDLAFLEIPTKDHEPLQMVEDYRFRRGQRLIAIGNPGRGDGQVLENAVSEGILSTQTDVEGQPYYQLSISINVGNSGGPVLNDEGDVLGIVTLKGTKTEGVAFCIPPDAINEAIATVRRSDPTFIAETRSRHEKRVPLQRGIDKMSLLPQVPAPKLQEFAQDVVKDFEEAVRQTPEEADAYLGRGVCRALMGDVDGTISDFETATQLAPDREELIELRDTVRRERERLRQQQVAGSRPGQLIPLDHLQRFRPGVGGGRGGGPMISPEESALYESRYKRIQKKEEWTFNGKPLRGRLVGYEDGIAHFKPLDDNNGELIKRYANRFSRQDIADIVFYAQYNRIPLGNLRMK